MFDENKYRACFDMVKAPESMEREILNMTIEKNKIRILIGFIGLLENSVLTISVPLTKFKIINDNAPINATTQYVLIFKCLILILGKNKTDKIKTIHVTIDIIIVFIILIPLLKNRKYYTLIIFFFQLISPLKIKIKQKNFFFCFIIVLLILIMF